MPSGYTNRWKGKVTAVRIDFAVGATGIFGVSTVTGTTFNLTPTEMAVLDGYGTPVTAITTGSSVAAISPIGISIVPDTTFNSTYYLADPVPGAKKTFYMKSTVASSGTRSITSLTTGIGIYGSSQGTQLFDTLNFGSSKTILSGIEMLGVSSTSWLITGGAYNATTVPLTTVAVTLSTRT